jgi:hypothetical protein
LSSGRALNQGWHEERKESEQKEKENEEWRRKREKRERDFFLFDMLKVISTHKPQTALLSKNASVN